MANPNVENAIIIHKMIAQILRKAIANPTKINSRTTRNANNSIGMSIFFIFQPPLQSVHELV